MAVCRPRDRRWPDHCPWPAVVALAILLTSTLGLLKVCGLSLADLLRWLLWLIEGRLL
jgi:hypothetical protein